MTIGRQYFVKQDTGSGVEFAFHFVIEFGDLHLYINRENSRHCEIQIACRLFGIHNFCILQCELFLKTSKHMRPAVFIIL